MNCPQCGKEAEYDSVDIGVGEQRISPYYCHDCEWYEDYVSEQVDKDSKPLDT